MDQKRKITRKNIKQRIREGLYQIEIAVINIKHKIKRKLGWETAYASLV